MRLTPLPRDLREKPFSVKDARVRGITADRLDDAVRLGDARAGSWSPWPVAREIQVVELERAVESGRRRPGVASLRRAVEPSGRGSSHRKRPSCG